MAQAAVSTLRRNLFPSGCPYGVTTTTDRSPRVCALGSGRLASSARLSWKQCAAQRLTTLPVRRLVPHQRGSDLARCTTTEKYPDGSENSATHTFVWDSDGQDAVTP